ncbi:MAG: hypothetical protein FJ358_02350 [Thaumarchaeota archaeon]|nr:hypothetical protein [Nitrososphaerota archaeon]
MADDNLFQRYMGKRVRDVYGRYVGFVVGINKDPFGDLRSIGVDSGERGLAEFPGQCVSADGDSLVLLPGWKVDADRFKRETLLVNNRLQGVEDLIKESEITQEEYQDFQKVYQGYRAKLDEIKKVLDEKIKRRFQELDRELRDIKKLTTNVKLQFKSGEIDAESFRASLQYASVMKERVEKEKSDISATVSLLNSTAQTVQGQPIRQEKIETQSEMEAPPTMEIAAQIEGTSSISTEAGWLARFLKGKQ